jgi:hypothetical protein
MSHVTEGHVPVLANPLAAALAMAMAMAMVMARTDERARMSTSVEARNRRQVSNQ